MATVDNTYTNKMQMNTSIGGTNNAATAGIKKPGTGAAAGVTQTPPPPSGVGATTGFDAEYYLGTSPSVPEFTAADEKRLNDVADFVTKTLGEAAGDGAIAMKGSSAGETAASTASSNTYVTRRRTQDLMTLLSQVMNLERGMAIQKITNHALNNISELKQAAEDMRKSASKILSGAIANLVLTSAGSAVSMIGSGLALKETKTATDKLKPATELQEGYNKEVKNLQKDTATPVAQRSADLSSQIDTTKSNLRTQQTQLKGIHSAADIHTKTAESFNMIGRAAGDLANATGRFTEAYFQVESKRMEADMAEKQANAQLEQGTKDMALQNLNAIKTMVEALINAFKEIRDTQDQVKANIARNA